LFPGERNDEMISGSNRGCCFNGHGVGKRPRIGILHVVGRLGNGTELPVGSGWRKRGRRGRRNSGELGGSRTPQFSIVCGRTHTILASAARCVGCAAEKADGDALIEAENVFIAEMEVRLSLARALRCYSRPISCAPGTTVTV